VPSKEDLVTDVLMGTLRAMPPGLAAKFCADVFGVTFADDEHLEIRSVGTTDVDFGDDVQTAAVVGLSGTAAISTSPEYGWAESRPDALITDGRVAVALEAKLPRGKPLTRSQLLRHASQVRLDVPWDEITVDGADIPECISAATWAAVDAWLEQHGHREAAAALTEQRGRTPEIVVHARPQVVRCVPPAPVTSGRDIAAAWDLRRVRELCTQRYARERVTAQDCPDDTARMVAAYRAEGLTAPPGLRFSAPDGGAMTPERTLSLIYAGSRYRNACPATPSGFRDRTVRSGFDQHALAALWAWAARNEGAVADRIRRFVPRVYAEAPVTAPGLEELHALLAPARRQ
jgi:hypothetical protein